MDIEACVVFVCVSVANDGKLGLGELGEDVAALFPESVKFGLAGIDNGETDGTLPPVAWLIPEGK
jgi:hypothetical protein